MLMNKEQIKEIIPHREPFLLIDEILEMEVGKSVKAAKHVSADEYYFQGHFPAEPVMPGVLIVETMAQAGAVAVLSMPEYKGKTAYFGGIKNAKFRQKVVPGDTLDIEVNLEKMKRSAGTATCTATVNGKMACKCEILFAIG